MASTVASRSTSTDQIGMWVNLLEVDKLVKVNNLREITNPIYIDKRTFTPDGLLSNEIFGVSTYDRKNRFAYIDLKGHYMYPLSAVKLASYDRTLSDVLYARGTYKLVDGVLVEDENGDSGPEFLYSIWGKVKVKEKTTETTREIQKYFEMPRDKLFITKFPVIPAFFRDINLSATSSTKSSNVINSKYASIISYTQSLAGYSMGFANIQRITQARVQTLLVDIYNELMVKTVKGRPSKFGMLRRAMSGKNLPYTTRLVITASDQNKESVNRVQVKFGYATIPLAYVCSLFMPFMIHELKAYFDAQFIQGGKIQVLDSKTKKPMLVDATESYDENQLTAMINKFINSPSTRFDYVPAPPTTDGISHKMIIVGRFQKSNTTFIRPATFTDILYIVAERVVRDKHVYVTRYPMDNPNGQNPYRIMVSTTYKTEPVVIGNQVYEFYPIIKGDPLNAFMSTCQMSNTMLEKMGADFFENDIIHWGPIGSNSSKEQFSERLTGGVCKNRFAC